MSTYFEDGKWLVTDRIVRTPRKSFALEKVEGVTLKRTFFLFTAPPAAGALFLTVLWWRYLFAGEIAFLITVSILALIVSYNFGTLSVHALSLRDDESGMVYNRMSQLLIIRDAIETAMQARDTAPKMEAVI